jgi:hypothetical protein
MSIRVVLGLTVVSSNSSYNNIAAAQFVAFGISVALYMVFTFYCKQTVYTSTGQH